MRMRLRLAAGALLILAVGMAAPTPASAMRCQCIGGYIIPTGVVCTAWEECPILVSKDPKAPWKEMRSANDCPTTRAIYCPPAGKCRLVCGDHTGTKTISKK
jgi:hypothetical protein